MTQEEKDILYKELMARTPYKVLVLEDLDMDFDGGCISHIVSAVPLKNGEMGFYLHGGLAPTKIEWIRPYLRPLSSMTKEEKEELKKEHEKDALIYAEALHRIANGDETARGTAIPHYGADWCNVHHFDYRGLIDKGLAIDTTKQEYNPYKDEIYYDTGRT